MRYRPKSVVALHIALGGLPGKMRVEVDRGIEVSATTVGELRKFTLWPENLMIAIPSGVDPEGTVKVSTASRSPARTVTAPTSSSFRRRPRDPGNLNPAKRNGRDWILPKENAERHHTI